MSILLFLNELSCGTDTDRHRASEAMSEFVRVLRGIRGIRPDIALVSEQSAHHLEISCGYRVGQWMNDSGSNRDRARLLLSLQNRVPVRSVLPEGAADESEFRHDGVPCVAFQAAHLRDGSAVSLPVDDRWSRPWVRVAHTRPVEEDGGEVALRTSDVELRHCSTSAHVGHHEDWFRNNGVARLASGSAIWAARVLHFPNLSFLPRVEGDLADLRPAWAIPVRDRLLELQEAVAAWDPTAARAPDYCSKVSGESESRRRQGLVDFTDLDGHTRLFELHARFTPGAGRLHFRLVPEERQARVAYIGPKLGI